MDSERAASVSWERSRTVSEPMRPLPHLVSCARTTGPKVSQSSYQAAWSLPRRRPIKPVVMGVSIAAQGYHRWMQAVPLARLLERNFRLLGFEGAHARTGLAAVLEQHQGPVLARFRDGDTEGREAGLVHLRLHGGA